MRGRYSGAVTSPPYADQKPSEPIAAWVLKIVEEKGMSEAVRQYRAKVMDEWCPAHGRWTDENIQKHIEAAIRIREGGHYSGVVTSPPYAGEPGHRENTESGSPRLAEEKKQFSTYRRDRDPAQIGNLRDPKGDIDGVVTSPPYEGSMKSNEDPEGRAERTGGFKQGMRNTRYGESRVKFLGRDPSGLSNEERAQLSAVQNNIGQCVGETYLAAMLAVYRELHAVLKPGGVVCLVTKNPVKAGEIRRLDEDTIRLMQAAGFILIERFAAMLTEELGEQQTLDGGSVRIKRERKSFFKRLYERKHPDRKVEHEDVLWFQKIGEVLHGRLFDGREWNEFLK